MKKVLDFTINFAPTASKLIEETIEEQKKVLFLSAEEVNMKERPLIGKCMDIMMWAMILYFVVTFLNQVVRNHL